jgi:hypothetical protein
MVMANQHGWMILNPEPFRVRWNGDPSPKGVQIQFRNTQRNDISTHFGMGIVTVSIPYLFRTPQGVNLWVRGPANQFKDGIFPLEGIVETDWSVATFTMNWKITRGNTWITFDQREPLCMLTPIPRGFLESLEPVMVPISADVETEKQFKQWSQKRNQFNAALANHEPEATKQGWEKDYFKGRDQAGNTEQSHQTKLQVRQFSHENK